MTKSTAQVSIHMVSWNSINHLSVCLNSIAAQTYQDWQIMIADNASEDGSTQWLAEHAPHIPILRNTRNTGFCVAQNQLLRITHSPYVLMMNPDLYLDSTWLAQAVSAMETDPTRGSFGGKVLRFSYQPGELKEIEVSGIIDTAALKVFRNRHVIDRGAGETDQGQYSQAESVFGLSGACVLYRRAALESIRWHNEYLDEDLFAYKDDFDLSWRLQRAGWVAWYQPQALAYHHRTAQGITSAANLAIAKNHRRRQEYLSFYSYRNHWLVLLKNETWLTLWPDLPWIAWYEGRKFVYLLFAHPRALRGLLQVIRLARRMRHKAADAQAHSKRPPAEVRRWFLHSS